MRTKNYSSKAGHVPTSHRTNQIRQSGNEEAQQTRERWIDHWKQRRWISGISGGKKEWILKGDFFLKQKSSFTHFLRYKRRINEDFCERDFFPFLWWPVWMSGNLQWFKLFVLLVAVVFGPRPQIVITYRADSGPGVVLLIFLVFKKKKRVIKSSERWLNPTEALKGWHQGSLLSHKTWNEDVTVNRWKTDFDWQSAAFPFLHMCVVVILVCEPIRADNLTWAPRKEQQQVFHVQVNVSLLWSTHVLCSLYICNTKARRGGVSLLSVWFWLHCEQL